MEFNPEDSVLKQAETENTPLTIHVPLHRVNFFHKAITSCEN